MELSIEPLPAFEELDDTQREEIESFILAGRLSPEDAPGYGGWLIARAVGSHALIGCVGYERETIGDTNNIYMQSLVVAKDHRRKGIGRLLTDKLHETAVSPGEKLVALTLFWNNTFYQNLDFHKVDAKEIKASDAIAGREKHKYCTAWVKERD